MGHESHTSSGDASSRQRLAVVVTAAHGIVAIHLTHGWQETLAVARIVRVVPSWRVYVAHAEDVTCRWARGGAPRYAQRGALRRAS